MIISAAIESQGLKEGDLVILTLRRPLASAQFPSDTVNSLPPERRVFGYVRQTQRLGLRSSEQLHPLIGEFNDDDVTLCCSVLRYLVNHSACQYVIHLVNVYDFLSHVIMHYILLYCFSSSFRLSVQSV